MFCIDGRSALLMAIDNENLEMVELLLESKVILHIFVFMRKKTTNKNTNTIKQWIQVEFLLGAK